MLGSTVRRGENFLLSWSRSCASSKVDRFASVYGSAQGMSVFIVCRNSSGLVGLRNCSNPAFWSAAIARVCCFIAVQRSRRKNRGPFFSESLTVSVHDGQRLLLAAVMRSPSRGGISPGFGTRLNSRSRVPAGA